MHFGESVVCIGIGYWGVKNCVVLIEVMMLWSLKSNECVEVERTLFVVVLWWIAVIVSGGLFAGGRFVN